MESGGFDEFSNTGRSQSDQMAAQLGADVAYEASKELAGEASRIAAGNFCSECFVLETITGAFLLKVAGRFNDLNDSADRGR